jgi:hypothetical protein
VKNRKITKENTELYIEKIILRLAFLKIFINPQIAHLQFARATAKIENCKGAIFLPNPQFQYIFEKIKQGIIND